jgi:DNA invertase Pin-like site-specific DNA recombinase
MISERTKVALQAAKARGKRLGNPRLSKAAARGTAAGKAAADQFAANVLPVIMEIQAGGVISHNAIAAKLNERRVKTARSGRWSHVQVGMILARMPA